MIWGLTFQEIEIGNMPVCSFECQCLRSAVKILSLVLAFKSTKWHVPPCSYRLRCSAFVAPCSVFHLWYLLRIFNNGMGRWKLLAAWNVIFFAIPPKRFLIRWWRNEKLLWPLKIEKHGWFSIFEFYLGYLFLTRLTCTFNKLYTAIKRHKNMKS